MSKVMMGFVGDVLVNREDPHEIFREVRDILSVPELMFANLEGAYTDDPRPVPTAVAGGVSAPAHNLDAYSAAGFNVMSLANNHILDVGYDAMLETRARLRDQGIRTCGAGSCLADAHEPAIVEAGNIRIAILAYASIFPLGYEGRSNKPGLAPMRAYNFWRDPYPTVYSPGMQPVVTTIPDENDLAYLTQDIQQAKEKADIVITSFHWGDMTCAFRLTDHEKRTAKLCIDQGASMVVGHHHHAIRGMEWYKGKPIMYGLGHFVFDQRIEWDEGLRKELLELFPSESAEQPQYTVAPREGWPLLPMHEDTRMTLVAWATAYREGVSDIGFLPCRLTSDGLVHPLMLDSAEAKMVISYFERCNKTEGLKGRITTDNSIEIAGFKTLRIVPD